MEVVVEEITSVQEEIDATKAEIKVMGEEIRSLEWKMGIIQEKIDDTVTDIKNTMEAVTTTEDTNQLYIELDLLAKREIQLRNEHEALQAEKLILHNEKLALRKEKVVQRKETLVLRYEKVVLCMETLASHKEKAVLCTEKKAKQERVRIAMTSPNNKMWILDNLGTMRRREKEPLPIRTPKKYIGREAAISAIQNVAKENFTRRREIGDKYLTFLVASGHGRNGKTRAGIETSRLVEEMCSDLSTKGDHNGTCFSFAKPVYLFVDFLNGAQYNTIFDVDHNLDASVALGARLMYAFYQQDSFKAIKHDQALKHIIATVLSEAGASESMVVPIVIHFDEHGEFVHAMSSCRRANQDGKMFFEDMLNCLGSAATSLNGALSNLKLNGRFFLVPITTGNSHNDASFSQVSKYGVRAVPLPLLSISDTRKLASAFLKGCNADTGLLCNTIFQIALCDCGSLPGLVKILCQHVALANNSFVHYLHGKVNAMVTGAPGWSSHWKSLTSIFFARVKLSMDDYIDGTYTVEQALASGTVSYDHEEREIRLAPVLLRIFNMRNPLFNPLILKFVTETDKWTWQDYVNAHLLYLAAAMMSLQKEKMRFATMILSNFLCHVQPANNAYLHYNLVLPSDVTFNGAGYQSDDQQCLDRPQKRKRTQQRHRVNTECYDFVRRAATGTPYVDGYMNLILRRDISGTNIPTTLFMQYKHSETPQASSPMKVSEMNNAIEELEKSLDSMVWEANRHWLLLWVTNRIIEVDVKPHEKLLWVGKNELESHAPLIGSRGLL